jgi:hypothetical protein
MQLGQDFSHEIGYFLAAVSSAMKSTTRETTTLLATLFISAYYSIAYACQPSLVAKRTSGFLTLVSAPQATV